MPYFSVIVPVYNVEKYLVQCVDSILLQTFADFEVILVDDGSKDGSGQICDEYGAKDSRITVVHKPNGGLVSARKAGAEKCLGKYIVNVDSDDYIAPDFLEHIHGGVEADEPDVFALGFTITDEKGNCIERCYNPVDSGRYDEDILSDIRNRLFYDFSQKRHNSGSLFYSVWSKAIKRELYKQMQMEVPDLMRTGEDLAVTIPAIYAAKTIVVSSYTGYFYRFRETSITKKFNPEEVDRIALLLKYISEHIPQLSSEKVMAYTVSVMLGQLVLAARVLGYGQFKAYIKTKCADVMYPALKQFKHKRLNIGSKLRLLVMRLRLWSVFWLVYHK